LKARKHEMSKQEMREESERLVKDALERKTLTVKKGETRIDSKCRKCGTLNRVSAAQGQVRVPYMCKGMRRETKDILTTSTPGLNGKERPLYCAAIF
jgi:hypothetical protein